jgi:hypothetical protein
MSLSGTKIARLAVAGALLGVLAASALPAHKAAAAQITSRSLTLQDGTTDGASKPSGVVKHLFTFTIPSGTSLGSIQFLYCTTAAGTCTTPTGLSTTGGGVTLTAQTGPATGFTLNNSTQGAPYITRTAATITPGTASTFQLSGVTNPSATNTSFFVRITTFSSTDATTGATDSGTVTASTATQIVLSGTMPESIIFCTGQEISVNGGGIPDCSTATAGAIDFNQLFSPTDTAVAMSQMAASTNAVNGYAITVSGATMTSGANTITAMGTVGASTQGIGQFGLNLVANTSAAAASFPGTVAPYISADIAAPSNGTTLKGEAIGDYDTADNFKFASGETVADSANGGAGPTDAQIYTVSYIVNVPGRQAAGTYTTTLTYTCTATF